MSAPIIRQLIVELIILFGNGLLVLYRRAFKFKLGSGVWLGCTMASGEECGS